ncbi:hypothetical protein [uncultured Christiangramia sp.]|uniref:hypothetical protein n=1 Tax=uncultured Christiangramia sp. TaxID=503836 RepID=UPI00260E638F|nr:hypothetical protein [uncultured Christiangramia sp.]
MNKEQKLKRLSIIKLLFRIGIEQSKKNEMLAQFSILSFHDSIEMFLKLATEIRDKKDCKNFMQYWEQLPELTLKESMRNLNTIRVNLKHKGVMPSKLDIESARVNSIDFFNQNTKKFFDIEFKEISLFELIKFERCKTRLIKADKFLSENQLEESAKESTLAFQELLEDYKETKSDQLRDNPFKIVESISYRKAYWEDPDEPIDRNLKKLFQTVNENFRNLEKAVEVLTLGLDYKKYAKFKILTPEVMRTLNGEYHFHSKNNIDHNKENCEFLIDFILDSALTLQEFDFAYDDLGLSPKNTVKVYFR